MEAICLILKHAPCPVPTLHTVKLNGLHIYILVSIAFVKMKKIWYIIHMKSNRSVCTKLH